MIMRFGKIGEPIAGFDAKKQIIEGFLNSQYWEMPFNWDWGYPKDAIDPVRAIEEGIKKYLDFEVDSIAREGSQIIIYLDGEKVIV